MAAKRISLKKVLRIIAARHAICCDAVTRHEEEGQPEMAASERCAAFELRYIMDLLTKDQSHDQ